MGVVPGKRVARDGKQFALGGRPFRVRGVTYGSFADRGDGALFPEPARVHQDFAAMTAAGLNTVRTYTLPPADVLEAAAAHGLRLLVGLDYHDWRLETDTSQGGRRRILDAGRRAVVEVMELCAGRPEVLAVAVGNEVPGDLVRVHGIGAVERTLARLLADVHEADPAMLACYTSFPTTEYLDVAGQDFACFNVFLERPEQLRAYLGHLQVVVGDLPLLIGELGLASEAHGEERQAEVLEWQLRAVDEAGCAGAAVFAWTDEWAVGGRPVTGWGFGLTQVDRRPKRALHTVAAWAASSLADLRSTWPAVSAVVCAYNAERTLAACVESLLASDYPRLEVIVCDDGSTDGTRSVAERFPVRVLPLEHAGLGAARNAGIDAANGDIVAFLDADARCHSDWPYRLALALEGDAVGAVGGPNLPVPEAGFVERAVGASPGAPVCVLVSDDRAEHVAGCNMAFRRAALAEIGGFDPLDTTAGDDVDLCWRVLDGGYQIAFAPAAHVLHHRRATVRGYLRQQRAYGRAERVVAARHPDRFNGLGQARWRGFIYGGPRVLRALLRPVVYHGPMGTALFQGVVRRRGEAALAWSCALLPVLVPFALLGLLAPVSPWWLLAPLLVAVALAAHAGAVAVATVPAPHERRRLRFRLLVGALHVLQPLVRTWGRVSARVPETARPVRPSTGWTGDRRAWLRALEQHLVARGCAVTPGRAHDPWDLEARHGFLSCVRITTAVAWGWTPLRRLQARPRRTLLAITAVAVVATAVEVWATTALVAVAVTSAVEVALLRRRVRDAIAATTPPPPAAEERATSRLELARAAAFAHRSETSEAAVD